MKKQEKYTVYLGLNDMITGVQEISTKIAIRQVKEIASEYFEGCTISLAYGIFDKKPERTIRIELMNVVEDYVVWFAEDLRDIFNQNCVLIEKYVAEIAFI